MTDLKRKRRGLVVSVIVLLVAVAALVAQQLPTFEARLLRTIQSFTGQNLTGLTLSHANLSWNFAELSLEVTGHQLTLADTTEPEQPPSWQARIGTLRFRITPVALWSGEVAIDRIIADDVTVTLHQPAQQPNNQEQLLAGLAALPLSQMMAQLAGYQVDGIQINRLQLIADSMTAELAQLSGQLDRRSGAAHLTAHGQLSWTDQNTWQRRISGTLTGLINRDGTLNLTATTASLPWSDLLPPSSQQDNTRNGQLQLTATAQRNEQGVLTLALHSNWQTSQHRGRFTASGQRSIAGLWHITGQINDPLYPADWVPWLPEAALLAGLQLPLQGQLSLDWHETTSTPITIHWQLTGGSGQVDLSPLFRWPIPIGHLTAHGQLQPQGSDWDLAVEQFTLHNSHGNGQGQVTLTGLGGTHTAAMDLTATASGVTTEQARFYYPAAIMPESLLHWLDTALEQGRVSSATARIKGPLDSTLFTTAPSLFRIEGTVDNGTLRYLPYLPPLHHIRTTLLFDKLSMSAQVLDGQTSSARDLRGTVHIADMTRPIVDIRATGQGNLDGLWRDIVTNPQLGWDRLAGLTGTQLRQGQGQLALQLALDIGRMEQSRYNGELEFQQGHILLPWLSTPLEQLQGRLTFDKQRLQLQTSSGQMAATPFTSQLEVRHYTSPTKQTVDLRTIWQLSAEQLSRWLDPLLTAPVTGQATLQIDAKKSVASKGSWELAATASSARMGAEGLLGWQVAGPITLKGNGQLLADRALRIDAISAQLGNLSFTGSALNHPDQDRWQATVNEIKLGQNQGRLDINHDHASGWRLRIDMPLLDLRPLLARIKPPSSPPPPPSPPSFWPKIDIRFHAKRVILASEPDGQDLRVDMLLNHTSAQLNHLNMQLEGSDSSLSADGQLVWRQHVGQGPWQGHFNASSQDIGAVARLLDLHQGLESGSGTVTAQLSGTVPEGQRLVESINGDVTLKARNGVLRKMGLFARLLALFSLDELPGLLTGDRPDLAKDGVYYHMLQIPVTLKESIANLHHAELSGPSMKIVVSGSVDWLHSQQQLLVGLRPLQLLDRLVNLVPLLGKLLSGSRETLIEYQFDVTGSSQDPVVHLRPFDSLAPGILKDILTIPGKIQHYLLQDKPKDPPQE
ncbi:MAG: AsmA-like C-terminal domain-containing protein [Magnetococcales bacterium]|nr:AsmA-like C-terminal domain-containing protein [Magnetococcales bacterium]